MRARFAVFIEADTSEELDYAFDRLSKYLDRFEHRDVEIDQEPSFEIVPDDEDLDLLDTEAAVTIVESDDMLLVSPADPRVVFEMVGGFGQTRPKLPS